jgi:hypothetical protein
LAWLVEQLDLLLGPLAVTGHRALAQALEDRRGVILDLVVGRQIERPGHGLKVRRAEERLDVLLERHDLVSGRHDDTSPDDPTREQVFRSKGK